MSSNGATSGNVAQASTKPIDATRSDRHDQIIKSIALLSTGSAEAHPEHQRGTWLPLWWWVLTSQRWMDIPINFFVIEHRDGLILFDTGLDPWVSFRPLSSWTRP